jgi:hypothetical protein
MDRTGVLEYVLWDQEDYLEYGFPKSRRAINKMEPMDLFRSFLRTSSPHTTPDYAELVLKAVAATGVKIPKIEGDEQG